jgi:phosphocarrier protein HPr
MDMVEQQVTVTSKSGLHARPASVLVKESGRFQSKLTLTKEGKSVDMKSILGIMSLAVMPGETVWIQAEGADEQEAIEQLSALFASGLGEEA